MQIFRINRLPLYQAPDAAPGGGDPPPVDPAVIANSDPANPAPAPAADPPQPFAGDPPAPAISADPPANPDAPTHGNKGKKPWFLDRISEETYRAQQAEARAAAAEALLESVRRGGGPADPAQPNNNNVRQVPAADDAAVEARARAIVAQQQISGVISAGISKFTDWDERAAILGSAGAASPDFVMDVIAIDPVNAHEILHKLSDDPAKAARLAKMDTRARTIELVKMTLPASQAAPQPEPKPATPPKVVSKAPTPPPAIEPSASQVVDWRSDKASDQDFSKGWDQMMSERAKRGRR